MSCCKKTSVKEYYGKVLQDNKDLKTSVCTAGALPERLMGIPIHDEVLRHFYGCGICIPDGDITGMKVLDLGSGSGRDVYILSKLVGEAGHVTGIDMTEKQVTLAKTYQDYHREQYGYSTSNVTFHEGYIESFPMVTSESIDLVISNCVINLSPDKPSVFKEVYRVLKPGGRLYFSDIYTNEPIPEALQQDQMLWGECLSGALCVDTFQQIVSDLGFHSIEEVSSSPVSLKPSIASQLPSHKFHSITFSLRK